MGRKSDSGQAITVSFKLAVLIPKIGWFPPLYTCSSVISMQDDFLQIKVWAQNIELPFPYFLNPILLMWG